jgi:hypothetical protein
MRKVMRIRRDAPNNGEEAVVVDEPLSGTSVTLRLRVSAGGICLFDAGPSFTARPGRWVGAKVGLFAIAPSGSAETGSVIARSFVVR